MPPPHLPPPPERAEPARPFQPEAAGGDGARSGTKLGLRKRIGWLFWVGIGIAPLAALLLVLGQGVGPLRAAAVMAVLSVVLIGLSVVLRDDAAMVKDDVEEQLRTEVEQLRSDIDSLRRGVEISVHRELERVHRELEATRREGVLRAESTRLNRLTGALPAAEDGYIGGAERVDDGYGRGRGTRPPRAITDGRPGYDDDRYRDDRYRDDRPAEYAAGRPTDYPDVRPAEYAGGTASVPAAPQAAQHTEQIRYEAATYGSARPAADDRQQAGTEYVSVRSFEGEPYPTPVHGRPDVQDRPVRYAEEPSYAENAPYYAAEQRGYEAPREDARDARYEEPQYDVLYEDSPPPVYTPEQRGEGGYRSAERASAGTIDYGEFWDRSASPDRPEHRSESRPERPVDERRPDGPQADPASEWSSWRSDTDWNTGGHRYDRDDPQVITGALTGNILDVPYSVGGQPLGEPEFAAGPEFGAEPGFGAGNGFGEGNGFASTAPWWEDPSFSEANSSTWKATNEARADDPSAEFELPSLEHLPEVAGAPPRQERPRHDDDPPAAAIPEQSGPEDDEARTPAGGRHASSNNYPSSGGRYRSW